eukprot:1136886-Pelagomonas_calceolata.AAC.4
MYAGGRVGRRAQVRKEASMQESSAYLYAGLEGEYAGEEGLTWGWWETAGPPAWHRAGSMRAKWASSCSVNMRECRLKHSAFSKGSYFPEERDSALTALLLQGPLVEQARGTMTQHRVLESRLPPHRLQSARMSICTSTQGGTGFSHSMQKGQ